MNETTTTTKPKPNIAGLHNMFAGFELPDDMKQLYKAGLGEKLFGPKNKAKLALFLQENKEAGSFTDIYNHYIKIKPQRQDGESDVELKSRSKFQKVLAKQKMYFYDYQKLLVIKSKKTSYFDIETKAL